MRKVLIVFLMVAFGFLTALSQTDINKKIEKAKEESKNWEYSEWKNFFNKQNKDIEEIIYKLNDYKSPYEKRKIKGKIVQEDQETLNRINRIIDSAKNDININNKLLQLVSIGIKFNDIKKANEKGLISLNEPNRVKEIDSTVKKAFKTLQNINMLIELSEAYNDPKIKRSLSIIKSINKDIKKLNELRKKIDNTKDNSKILKKINRIAGKSYGFKNDKLLNKNLKNIIKKIKLMKRINRIKELGRILKQFFRTSISGIIISIIDDYIGASDWILEQIIKIIARFQYD